MSDMDCLEYRDWLADRKTVAELEPVRGLQKVLLEILHEIDCVCRRHNLRYSLFYGSLLGAVRHKGFIPWDDDADIAMPRDDYERFLRIAENELPKGYFMQSYRTEEGYRHPFAKVRKDGTTCINVNHRHIKMHHGIFVDVFPLDKVPNNVVLRFIIWGVTMFLEKMAAFSCANLPRRLTCLRPIQYVWQVLIGPRFFNKSCNFIAAMFRNRNVRWCRLVCYPCTWSYSEKTKMPATLFDSLDDVEMDGFRFLIPRTYHELLRICYGDYSKLPPRQERHPAHSDGGIIDVHNDYRRYTKW